MKNIRRKGEREKEKERGDGERKGGRKEREERERGGDGERNGGRKEREGGERKKSNEYVVTCGFFLLESVILDKHEARSWGTGRVSE